MREMQTAGIYKKCEELIRRGHGGYNIMMRAFEMAENELGENAKLEELRVRKWKARILREIPSRIGRRYGSG